MPPIRQNPRHRASLGHRTGPSGAVHGEGAKRVPFPVPSVTCSPEPVADLAAAQPEIVIGTRD